MHSDLLPNTVAGNRHRHCRWEIFIGAANASPLGELRPPDEREAIDKPAKEFRQHASKLIAVRRK
jgi:hypothetical protein